MKNKVSKTETKNIIQDFFSKINNKEPKQIKKIKKLAMSHNIKLKDKKKLFCKKCMNPYKSPKTRIKNKIKSITCRNCNHISRWKLK